LQKNESEKNQELYQKKLRFFTNVSYDLRIPLTLIKGTLERLIKQENGNKQFLPHLKVIHRNTIKLYKLVDQILDFHKLDSGNLNLQVSENNIIEYIYDILKSFDDHVKS